MKENILEYHPNGRIKHKIEYHPNGWSKKHKIEYTLNGGKHEYFYDPAIQSWFDNGSKSYVSYVINDKIHNICNPATILYSQIGKISGKGYNINHNYFSRDKLSWLNNIKNI